jgi:hypothetical protein
MPSMSFVQLKTDGLADGRTYPKHSRLHHYLPADGARVENNRRPKTEQDVMSTFLI